MVDPTSDLGEDVDEDTAPECETCGTKIVQLPTHRVVTEIEDGVVAYHHFCSDDCRTAEFDDESADDTPEEDAEHVDNAVDAA